MPVTTIDGLRVSYTDSGSGLCVVFVPGLVGSRDWFGYQVSGLSDHYRVVSYDLRGFPAPGRSQRLSRPEYTVDLLAEDLAAFLEAIHIHEAAVAGYSLGGLVALRFAAAHPERCLLLALDSTTPAPPPVSDSELVEYYVPAEFRQESFLARLRMRLFGAKPPPEDESDPISSLKRSAAELDPALLATRTRLMRNTDLTALLPELNVPTVVIAGSLEQPYILSASQAMDEVIPDSALEIIENADQYHFHTSHDRFNSILADHLSHRVGIP